MNIKKLKELILNGCDRCVVVSNPKKENKLTKELIALMSEVDKSITDIYVPEECRQDIQPKIFKSGPLGKSSSYSGLKLKEILDKNVGKGIVDIVWGPDIELLENKLIIEGINIHFTSDLGLDRPATIYYNKNLQGLMPIGTTTLVVGTNKNQDVALLGSF